MPDPDSEPTLREIADYLRQIESSNYSAALARAEREIAHEMYLLDSWWSRALHENTNKGDAYKSD